MQGMHSISKGERDIIRQLVHTVLVRDMMLRAHLDPEQSLELNRQFTEYQKHFGEALKLAKLILGKLT